MDLPALCPICNSTIDSKDIICAECRDSLDSECFDSFMSRCPVCCHPKVADFYECDVCSGRDSERIYPVARYDGPLSFSIIDSFKFRGHKEMARVVAMYLKRAVNALDPEGKAVLVPVPCSGSRLGKLGWDPMIEVCKATGRRFVPLISNRGDRRIQQKRMNREQRIGASGGRFMLDPGYSDMIPSLMDKKVIVVDDIVTTMSTMNSAISLLRSCGLKDVAGASWLCEL